MEKKRSLVNKFKMWFSLPRRGIFIINRFISIHGYSEERMASNKSEPEEEKFPPIILQYDN